MSFERITQRIATARMDRGCSSCGRSIRPGDRYYDFAWSDDGDFHSGVTCGYCATEQNLEATVERRERVSEEKRLNQQAVALWNRSMPPGSAVVLTDDLGNEEGTKTRSKAWHLGCGTPVVLVEGRAGGYLLERLVPAGMESA